MTDLPRRIAQAIEARNLFRRGEKVLVAVSGGLDSMALLNVLHALRTEFNWKLTVAHFNHQLRGRSSKSDERLARKAAERLSLQIVVDTADVHGLAKKQKLSIEMAARKLRHEFLAAAAKRLKIKKVVVAHHADDQLELFFLRLFRGASPEGLAGMRWRNPSPSNSQIEIVRPFLAESKTALREYVKAKEIDFREDATNASLDFQRNRIRNQLLPLLQKNYQSALARTVLRLADILRDESDFVASVAQEWLSVGKVFGQRKTFAQLPVAIQRRCLQLQLLQLRCVPDYEMIEELRLRADHPFTASSGDRHKKNLILLRGADGMIRTGSRTDDKFQPESLSLSLEKGVQADFAGARLRWKSFARNPSRPPQRKENQECFDADRVGRKIVLRHWQPGDRFQPIGMSSPVKLQDLFTNQKIPKEWRRKLIVGVTAQGELFWVENLRISEKFKLTDTTIRCLQWGWKRL